MNGVSMSPHMKWGIAGIVVGLILFIISPWLALAVIAAAIAIPTAAWFMLDESQRRRYRELRRRQRELH
jgi:ABC-type bacteriocin/lantibiotic exporter with double-glycine peptidase domain